MSSFQKSVNYSYAPGFAGDRADANPFSTAYAQNGGLVAGANGVNAGQFVWLDPSDPNGLSLTITPQSWNALGIVLREQNGIIPTYLQGANTLIPEGFPATVCTGGNVFVIAGGPISVGQPINAGANGVITGGTDNTGFVAVSAAAQAGDIVVVSAPAK